MDELIVFYRSLVRADLVSWSVITLVAVLVGGIHPLRSRRRPLAIATLVVLLWAIATPAGSKVLGWPLTRHYQPLRDAAQAGGARTLVVLGGGVASFRAGDETFTMLSWGSAQRVVEAARVYRLLNDPVVILAGGRAYPRRDQLSEAEAMRRGLVSLGVPADRMVLEERSRNTHEEAVHVAKLLRPPVSHVVLITSAWHMPRSLRAFRAAGIECIPSAAASTGETEHPEWLLLPSLGGLALSQVVIREYFALAYYWSQGRLSPLPSSAS